jgi:hypothetical protein
MNPFAFFESENPLEWDDFLHEPTADLWCPNTNSPNILHFLVKVVIKATDDVYYLDRFFFVPKAWRDEDEEEEAILRSELYTYDRKTDKRSVRRDHELTASSFESWENEFNLYTPVSMDYYH